MIPLTLPVHAMIQAIVIIGLISLTVDTLMRPRLKKLPPPSARQVSNTQKAA